MVVLRLNEKVDGEGRLEVIRTCEEAVIRRSRGQKRRKQMGA